MYKSLYPSIMMEFQIAPNTQIGRIDIDHVVYSGENAYQIESEKYSRGGEFIENMMTDNCIEFAKRWLHLAGINEFIEDMKEYESNIDHNFRRFKVVNGKLVQNPIYTITDKPIKVVVVGDQKPKAIYLFSTLVDNNISSNFDKLTTGDK